MTVLVLLALVLFVLKLLANLAGALELLRKLRKGETGGMSLMIEVEAFLLVLAVALSAMSTGEAFLNRPLSIAGWGLVAIALTYACMILLGAIGGWLVIRKGDGSNNINQ